MRRRRRRRRTAKTTLRYNIKTVTIAVGSNLEKTNKQHKNNSPAAVIMTATATTATITIFTIDQTVPSF